MNPKKIRNEVLKETEFEEDDNYSVPFLFAHNVDDAIDLAISKTAQQIFDDIELSWQLGEPFNKLKTKWGVKQMEEKSKTMIYVLKEIFKLPADEKTHTIKTADVIELVERLAKEIPEQDVDEFMKQTVGTDK